MPEPRRLALVAVLLLAIAGCGGGHKDGVDGAANVIDLTYSAGGAVKKQALDCATPSANDKPSCDLLAKLPTSVFKPVPAGQACTLIYGGPETATIKGTIKDVKVDATFSRTDGCEIDRFKQVEQLFAEMAGN